MQITFVQLTFVLVESKLIEIPVYSDRKPVSRKNWDGHF